LSRQALIFRARRHMCAVGLDQVVETMRPQPVRPLAGVPPYVTGVAVIRGAPTPVLSVSTLLDGDASDPFPAPTARLVTVDRGRQPYAFAVDEVLGIRTVPEPVWRELPPLLRTVAAVTAFAAVDGEPTLFLDAARALPGETWAALEPDPAGETP
jgi:purine-binding chemotaxis protein CheW